MAQYFEGKPKEHWRPAFAGRQNQTQGVEARQARGLAQSGRVKEGLFANIMMMKAVSKHRIAVSMIPCCSHMPSF
jgi:hypothetical protein